MRRRGFLAGLLALPFVRPIARVAARVKARLWPVVYVGGGVTGEATATTLASALAMVEPGGTVHLLPGHVESISEPLVIDKPGITIAGLNADDRPVLRLGKP